MTNNKNNKNNKNNIDNFKLKIFTSDNTEFIIGQDIIKHSPKLEKMIDENKNNKTSKDSIILSNVNKQTFANIISYLTVKNTNKSIKDFCKSFIENMTTDTLHDIIIASNELEIRDLVDICGAKIRSALDKDPSTVAKMFNL